MIRFLTTTKPGTLETLRNKEIEGLNNEKGSPNVSIKIWTKNPMTIINSKWKKGMELQIIHHLLLKFELAMELKSNRQNKSN
jgi:hypothetical protein